MDTREVLPIAVDAPSLLDLNDDCLELVLLKMNLLQQFQISKMHPRLEDLIQSIWRRRLRHVTVYPELLQDISGPDFVALLKTVGVHMERFLMHKVSLLKFRALQHCTFPKTTTFEWVSLHRNLSYVYDIIPKQPNLCDYDMFLLTKIFPNLRVLKLQSCDITGEHLRNFPALQELRLEECLDLNSKKFREIFLGLKLRKIDLMYDNMEFEFSDLIELRNCPTLEHIKISDFNLCVRDVIPELIHLPRLRKLSIYSTRWVNHVIERVERNGVRTIQAFKYNGLLYRSDSFFGAISKMIHLQKLALHNCRTIWNDKLLQLAHCLPELREVHLCACALESEEGLLHFVQHCRHLRLINITNTRNIKESFVWRCIELLRSQYWRSQPLQLWIKHTNIECSILKDPRVADNCQFININTTKSTVDTGRTNVLKFEFATID